MKKDHRSYWVKDIIRTIEGVYYIPSNWKEMVERGEKYHAVWSRDSQAARLLEEWDNGSGWVEAPYCVVTGNSVISMLEPFTSLEDAFSWIRENADKIYFGTWTVPGLREKFPDIPLQAHPSEYDLERE